MLRPKDKRAEIVAAACGVAALIAFYGFRLDGLAILLLIAGILVLAWAYLNVIRRR